jgi:hypothetical protein
MKDVKGISSATVVSSAGLPVASTLRPGKEGKMAAMVAALLSLSERTMDELERGPHEQALLRGGAGYILVREVGESYVLAVSTSRDVNLGMLFLSCEDSVENLLELLE